VTHDRWRNSAEIVGVVSIIITMAFVAYEIRQNTNATRSEIIQRTVELSTVSTELYIASDQLREALAAAWSGTPTADQRSLADTYYFYNMRIQLNRFLQSEMGVVDKETLLMLGGRFRMYRRHDFHQFWERNKDEYPVEFREFFDREVMSLPIWDPSQE